MRSVAVTGLALCLAIAISTIAPATAFYSSSGPVVELSPSNFESKIKNGGVWLVEFFAPWCGHCKNLKPAWEQAAGALKGIVNVAAVDCDAHQSIAQQYGVQGFPTIKLFYADGGKIKNVEYQGGRSAKDLITWGVDQAKKIALKRIGASSGSSSGSKFGGSAGGGSCGGGGGGGGGAQAGSCGGGGGGGGSAGGAAGGFYGGNSAVVSLGNDDFESEVLSSSDLWLVEFYAPWCGHCKNLKPTWEAAAKQLKGSAKLGAIDCTQHQETCGQYGVQGYPTIKVFGQNKNDPQDYNGGRDEGSIVEYARTMALNMAPPPEAQQLLNQEQFEEHCLSQSPSPKLLCFLVFLPNLLDSKAAGRNKYINILQKTAEAFKTKTRYSYFWVEGGSQPALEANFDVGGFGYPALVAYVPKEKRYITGTTAYELSHVKEWVRGLTYKVPAGPIRGELAKIKSAAPWDGQDAEEIIEDEFNLDDIMNEEL